MDDPEDMETAARYTEAKIKTYGFETRLDRCLCEFRLESAPGRPLQAPEAVDPMGAIPFDMVLMEPPDGNRFPLAVVVADRHRHSVQRFVAGMNPRPQEVDLRFTAPLELLFFFGPHFGDRFGIADATCRALSQNGIRPIACAFSSSSVFLLLPEHGAAMAKVIFADRFEIPKTVQRPAFISARRFK
jgi:hypothetical protein